MEKKKGSVYASLKTSGCGQKSFYSVSVDSGIEVSFFNLQGDSFSFSHKHRPYTLIVDFCRKGRIGWTMQNGDTFFAGENDFLIHNAGSCAQSRVKLPLGFYSGISLSFDLELIDTAFLQKIGTDFSFDGIVKNFCLKEYSQSFAVEAFITGIFSNLQDENLQCVKPLFKLNCYSLLIYLGYFERFKHCKLRLNSQIKTEKIRKIADFIKKDLQKRYTIADLSEIFGINPTSLQESFKDIIGQTVDDFVKEIRMNRAADLLSDTSLSIGEIAHRLGYKNQGKFSSAFKQRQGIGPFEYRKRIKKIFCED
ncbi:AraC family transcriptional regulator [Succinatimonas hippei]|uniref:helix-turn-helix domain-containing protein n=1 Tax=Succinatimonas hippei TaxID=626938 RepID=UPI0020132B40|nr:AraC family transcriptional regulator [Succinatimonas hippei]MCL1602603.1 AraC family transcriptional regulator [Succinatimonas hippei]